MNQTNSIYNQIYLSKQGEENERENRLNGSRSTFQGKNWLWFGRFWLTICLYHQHPVLLCRALYYFVESYINGKFYQSKNGEYIDIGDVRIIGATLWSDITPCKEIVKYMLPDYSNIFVKEGDRKARILTPNDTLDLHRVHLSNIEKALDEWSGPSIVITHHTPSYRSNTPGFEDSMINAAFMNELELEKWPTYWIHGHVHSRHNYIHNGCNVLCNPVGYRGEETEYLLTTNEFKL